MEIKSKVKLDFIKNLDVKDRNYGSSSGTSWNKTTSESELKIVSPTNGKLIASVYQASEEDYEKIITTAQDAFKYWIKVPAPKRGEVVRQIGNRLRDYKNPLGTLVSYEMGKSLQEGMGEVQEMIDICDFAVGQSRQLYGFTTHSERPSHRMYDQYHPLGIVATISAFNFPVAVWSWNALIAAVCGDVNLFKPSSKTPLTAIAVQNIIAPVVDSYDIDGVFNMIIRDRNEVGDPMLNDKRIPLISATGSTGMGIKVATSVAARLGRSLLELGGNNAIIITEDADLDMALRAVLFGAVGTAGQRCTSTRRIIVQRQIKEKFTDMLVHAYGQIHIGHPMADDP